MNNVQKEIEIQKLVTQELQCGVAIESARLGLMQLPMQKASLEAQMVQQSKDKSELRLRIEALQNNQ